MIDADLIESLDSQTRESVQFAVMALASSGILTAQRERLFRRVAEGADDASHDDIVEGIRRYRLESHGLLALQEYGEQLVKGIRNEDLA